MSRAANPHGLSGPGKTILIVDDDDRLVYLVRLWIERAGYRALAAYEGKEALRLFHEARPELVLLDIALPGQSGWEVCQRIRDLSDVPILMVTVRGEEADRVKGLGLGADDYITKPFSFRELVARVDAALRRATLPRAAGAPHRYAAGQLVIDFDMRQVFRDGVPLSLTPKEYRLLAYLAENAGRLLSHGEILLHVWGPEFTSDVDYVRMYVHALRQKIEPDPGHPHFLLTEHGAGYRLRQATVDSS